MMKDLDLEPLSNRSSWESPQEIHFRITSFSRQWATRPHLWRPPTDLYETETDYCARVEVAGMENSELNIAIENRNVAIYGLRQPPAEQAAYYQLEVRYGEFLSTLELPGEVDVESIQADYSDGFLIVRFPKAVKD
ncbi:MAG: Hsp20/alpha crystallin family protein [Anaerolineales bacterium]